MWETLPGDAHNGLPWGGAPLRRLASYRRRRWGGLWHSGQQPSWGTLEVQPPHFRTKEVQEAVWGLSSNHLPPNVRKQAQQSRLPLYPVPQTLSWGVVPTPL